MQQALADAVDAVHRPKHIDVKHVFVGDIGTIGPSCRVMERLTTGEDEHVHVVLGNRDLNQFRAALVLVAQVVMESEWKTKLPTVASWLYDSMGTIYDTTYVAIDTTMSKCCGEELSGPLKRMEKVLNASNDTKYEYAQKILAFMCIASPNANNGGVLATELYSIDPTQPNSILSQAMSNDFRPYPCSELAHALHTLHQHLNEDNLKGILINLHHRWLVFQHGSVEEVTKLLNGKKIRTNSEEVFIQYSSLDRHPINDTNVVHDMLDYFSSDQSKNALHVCMTLWTSVVMMYIKLAARPNSHILYKDENSVAVHAGLGTHTSDQHETNTWTNIDPKRLKKFKERCNNVLMFLHENARRSEERIVVNIGYMLRMVVVLDGHRDTEEGKKLKLMTDIICIANEAGVDLPDGHETNEIGHCTHGLASGAQFPTNDALKNKNANQKKELVMEQFNGLNVFSSQNAGHLQGINFVYTGHQPSMLGEIYKDLSGRALIRTDTQYNSHNSNACMALNNTTLDKFLRSKTHDGPKCLEPKDVQIKAEDFASKLMSDANITEDGEYQFKGVVRNGNTEDYYRIVVFRTSQTESKVFARRCNQDDITYDSATHDMPVVLNACYVQKVKLPPDAKSYELHEVFELKLVEKPDEHEFSTISRKLYDAIGASVHVTDTHCSFDFNKLNGDNAMAMCLVSPLRDCMVGKRVWVQRE